ncbi:3-dehydroquinate synthase [Rhynchospora pubera]|uniref:3-dehydroquinate synthase n=1 Tax=Rhynchospora pubera TaxID=906938 RepID=A0AAV8C4Y3_9POAL|nr:3-dehydroquinate synthase [Rhynchospora pubera]
MALGSFSFCQTATPPASVSSPGRASCTRKHLAIKMSKYAMRDKKDKLKMVWVWTENKEVFCASVERGWNTFLFHPKNRQLANDWSSIATIQPLFLEGSHVIDEQQKEVAIFYNVSSPQDLQTLKPEEIEADSLIISFQGEWQVIPAENIVAAFQGFRGAVLAVSTSSTDAQVFLEALEQGLDGVVLKVDKLDEIIRLKGYVERRNADCTGLELTRATISKVEVVGMGDRVCVDLCSIMRPGEGLLVGSFARGLFLVHSECLETNYIASRPFRVNAGPVHAYVAVPGGKTSYLSELCAGKEVLIVDQNGSQRTATVGRVKIESRPLILVEAKEGDETYNIFLQNAETVGLICPSRDNDAKTVIPVTSLKVGDEVLLRKQGGARHTGIEITEFILEK